MRRFQIDCLFATPLLDYVLWDQKEMFQCAAKVVNNSLGKQWHQCFDKMSNDHKNIHKIKNRMIFPLHSELNLLFKWLYLDLTKSQRYVSFINSSYCTLFTSQEHLNVRIITLSEKFPYSQWNLLMDAHKCLKKCSYWNRQMSSIFSFLK